MDNKHYLAAVLLLSILVMPVGALAGQNKTGYTPNPGCNRNDGLLGSTREAAAAFAIDWQLPAGFKVLDIQAEDITGDGMPDRVYLIGQKPATASGYADSFKLIVENGAAKTRTETDLASMGGYEARLFLGDFTGDHVADVLVTAATGGSGGWYDNRVVTFISKDTVIFNQQDNSKIFVSGQFKDGYKIELYNEAGAGSAVTLDVGERKADYVRLGLYDHKGTLKQQTRAMVTPFGRLEPVDVNNDGIYELKGLQRITGAYNADGLATVEIVLAYTGQEWQPRSVGLHINLHLTPDSR
ncbi:hypothetical protein [Sporomusa termitida]|uniref:Repeat domain in Vibrio, Colwellia, Bradyrhizobium and Shewanella n=1 Tax=Sporomusa termitida TaxID=2377 RepID=A0A517DVX3_9FIRM|nr:hypothetical protein [Sporomusa termitida]QDR81514.1 hypothetical protein SPTER_29000 [Sporomusa termitida]